MMRSIPNQKLGTEKVNYYRDGYYAELFRLQAVRYGT